MNKSLENLSATSMQELSEMIYLNEPSEMADNFMHLHEIALYHSDYPINTKEKTALFQLRELAELLKRFSGATKEENG